MSKEKAPYQKKPLREYQQLFSRSTSIEEIKKYEPFNGTVEENIEVLQKALKDKNVSLYIPAFRSYELLKFSVNEKIEIEWGNDYTLKDIAFDASQLAIDIALSCYKRDNQKALGLISQYEEKINSSGDNSRLKKMLKSKIDERQDLAFLPSCLEEEDFQIAEKMLELTKGKPVLMIGVGWRAAWRFPEIFSEYEYLSNTPDNHEKPGSLLQIERFSKEYNDFFHIKYPLRDKEFTREKAKGRTIVLIGASDKLIRFEHFVKNVIFTPNQTRGIEILKLPLKLTNT